MSKDIAIVLCGTWNNMLWLDFAIRVRLPIFLVHIDSMWIPHCMALELQWRHGVWRIGHSCQSYDSRSRWYQVRVALQDRVLRTCRSVVIPVHIIWCWRRLVPRSSTVWLHSEIYSSESDIPVRGVGICTLGTCNGGSATIMHRVWGCFRPELNVHNCVHAPGPVS